MKYLNLFLGLLVVSNIWCGCIYQTEEDILVVDANTKNDSISIDDVFSKIEVIPLETADECLMSGVDKICDEGGFIYILDKRMYNILKFDATGAFIHKLNKKGVGPDCYSDIEDFFVDPSNLNISTLSAYGKYNIYDDKDSLIYSNRIRYQAVHYFFPINSDLLALSSLCKDGRLLIYSLKKNRILQDFKMSEEFLLCKTPYKSIQSPFRKVEGRLLFLSSIEKRIYEVMQDGKLKIESQFSFGKDDYDARKLPADEEIPYYSNENKGLKKIYCLSDYAETDNWIMLHYPYDYGFNTLFINKENKKQRYLFNKRNNVLIYYPFFVNRECLYSIVSLSDLKRIVKREWLSNATWEYLDSLPIDSNPLIIKYSF